MPPTRRTRFAPVALAALLLAAPATFAHDGVPAAPAAPVDFPTSCTPAAQADFTAALTLWHHMTYPQAREAFAALAAREPACAMAHWGVAMTLFQPLWPMINRTTP